MVGSGLAGLPKTETASGSDLVTTVPIPIMQLFAILTFELTLAPTPKWIKFPLVVKSIRFLGILKINDEEFDPGSG